MTTTTRRTKRDMQREIDDLKSQVATMRNELSVLQVRGGREEYIPCGPITEIYGHPFEEEIQNAISDQYDGSTGWIVIEFWRGEFPFKYLLCNVSYSDADGTFATKFCQVARRVKNYDGEWVTE